jgi:hypothetical protein
MNHSNARPTRNLEEDCVVVRAAALERIRRARDVAPNVPADETITVRDPVTDTEVVVHRSKTSIIQRALDSVVVEAED